MTTIESLQTQIIRLRATCFAYEHLLVSLFDAQTEKESIRIAFEKAVQSTHGLLLYDDFSEEEIEANQTALEQLSRLLAMGSSEP
jgi:hypothetical protein